MQLLSPRSSWSGCTFDGSDGGTGNYDGSYLYNCGNGTCTTTGCNFTHVNPPYGNGYVCSSSSCVPPPASATTTVSTTTAPDCSACDHPGSAPVDDRCCLDGPCAPGICYSGFPSGCECA
ncbi:unnamed protein product [Adineta steineri]|uniref:Uncharacterized protein n=1 Tax=Adineta steineri TaxID=433720 RepID=A0A815BXI9_9BILA|nr:unnamed protein product [Adineta steineri]